MIRKFNLTNVNVINFVYFKYLNFHQYLVKKCFWNMMMLYVGDEHCEVNIPPCILYYGFVISYVNF